MKQHYLSLFVLTTLLVCTNSYGQITGKAWQDHNANGQIELAESGQAQLTVRAYDAQGKMVTSAVTDAQGYYRLDVPQGKQVRVEFSGIPEGYFPVSGHSRTQFVTSPGEASLGGFQNV